MSVFLELYCMRHRRTIKMFLIAFAVNHLPQPEKQSQAMNIAGWLSAGEKVNILY